MINFRALPFCSRRSNKRAVERDQRRNDGKLFPKKKKTTTKRQQATHEFRQHLAELNDALEKTRTLMDEK